MAGEPYEIVKVVRSGWLLRRYQIEERVHYPPPEVPPGEFGAVGITITKRGWTFAAEGEEMLESGLRPGAVITPVVRDLEEPPGPEAVS